MSTPTAVILKETQDRLQAKYKEIACILQEAFDATEEQRAKEATERTIATLRATITKRNMRILDLENELDTFKLQSAIQAEAIADLEKRVRIAHPPRN